MKEKSQTKRDQTDDTKESEKISRSKLSPIHRTGDRNTMLSDFPISKTITPIGFSAKTVIFA